jgi:hypothetical protein
MSNATAITIIAGQACGPADWQEASLNAHPDLYTRHPDGFARLEIRKGRLDLRSVNAAPFGVKPLFDPSRFDRQAMPK